MLNNFIKGSALFLLISSFIFCGVEDELKKINQKLDNIGKRLTPLEGKEVLHLLLIIKIKNHKLIQMLSIIFQFQILLF